MTDKSQLVDSAIFTDN